jgi:two-component system nitrogen regulation response regulator GlnG
LQDQRFERVGGNETVRTDVRVIAATNCDLEEAVAEGRFRQDLFYRLNGFTIRLPPLRERREDVPLLVEHLVKRCGRELGRQVHSASPDTLALLEAYDWPGNVRELQSAVKFALVHATGEVLTPACLPRNVRTGCPATPPAGAGNGGEFHHLAQYINRLLWAGETEIYRRVCQAADRVILDTVLRHAKGNQVQASELLGISRTTLRAKLRALGMTLEKQLQPEPEGTD